MAWTEEQQKVIDLRHRNILVSAAAGSGKTAVLVERIISMITDAKKPIDIDELLVVTFTRAAAAEMKERIGLALQMMRDARPEDAHIEKQMALLGSAQITTIDSFCLYVIRNHFNEIDLDPSFRVADEIELSLMQADVLSELLEDMYAQGSEDFLSFVECYAHGKTDQAIEDMLMQLYNYSRSYPWPEEWLDQCLTFLHPDSEEVFEQSSLMQFLKEYISNVVSDLKQQLVYAVNICLLPDGPFAYESAIRSDIAQIDRILCAENFSDIKTAFDDIKWEALSRKRMQASEKNKEIVKSVRKSVKDMINGIKEDFFYTDMAHMLSDIRMTAAPMAVLIDLVKQFSQRFQAVKEEKNIVDFSDLEHFALNILIKKDEDGERRKSDAALELSRQYSEILCDEYQDSNLVQETILNAISRESLGTPNVFMVGDVKQSIYKFRLARPELFMEKYNSYATDDSLYQRIDLHKNFRSRDCVIDFVNLIFEHIMCETFGGITYDESASLYAGAQFPESASEISSETELLLIDLKDDDISEDIDHEETLTSKEVEARAVAAEIQEVIEAQYPVLDKESGKYRAVQYRDIVILLRTMRGWSDVFTEVLTKSGIPAHSEVASGFFDTFEIRTIVCLLSVIDNPIQDIELAAVLKSFIGGFSDEALAMIRSVMKKGHLYDACISFMNPEADMILDEHFEREQYLDARMRLGNFLNMLDKLRKQAEYMNIHQLIMEVFEITGYDDLVSAMPYGHRRHANLELFIEKAVDYERTSYKGLFNFIRYIRKLRMQNSDLGEASAFGEGENAVRIVSIHKSKGLEYPIVFVSGMNKRFNKQDARSSVLIHADFGLGPEAVNETVRIVSPTIYKKAMAEKIIIESLSEELRVLYVALTRAKEKLIITGTVKDYEKSRLKWQQTAQTCGKTLSFKDLATASGFMDWIMPVLYNENYRNASNAQVKIEVIPFRSFIWQQTEAIVGNNALRADLNYKIETYKNTFDARVFDQRFDWRYPGEMLMNLPAKMTVSEIKKLNQAGAENDGVIAFETLNQVDEYSGIEKDFESLNQEESADDKAQRILLAARRGSAMHKLLELADFSQFARLDDVKHFIKLCVEKGLIAESLATEINPWNLYKFAKSKLGQRMAGAKRLYKEKQFIMAVDVNSVFKDVALDISGETILIQGIIDAFFEEADGIVLVDYKTDYILPGQEDVLIKRYAVQLDYYRDAIEKMTHKKVKERYIYSFSLGKEITV